MDAWFALPYGPLIIFAMRAVDVSLRTVRMILMLRGMRAVAASIGFVEVLIWVTAAGQALMHLDSPYHVVAYAGGFAAGNYLGVTLEGMIAMGTVVVHAIVPEDPDGSVAQALRAEGYTVTEVDGRGRDGIVDILNVVVKRKEAPVVIEHVETLAPQASVTVEEVRSTRNPVQTVMARPGLRR